MYESRNNNYISPFDGIRVIALFGVVLYHLFSFIFPSGFYGVVSFFVLAGFLSMEAIINRRETENVLSGIKMIGKKTYKLMPALVIVVILTSVVMTLFYKNFLKSYPIESISSIFFFNNYAQILNKESYFEAMNSMKPLTHLWALSLEMQFYIAFFLFLYTTYKEDRKTMISIALVIIYAISLVFSFILINKGESLTRVYYGFDTRINAFIIGILASIISKKIQSIDINNLLLYIIEFILLIITILCMFFRYISDVSTILLLVAYSLVQALFYILLSYEHFSHENKGILYKALSSNVASVIKKRSYVLYLVHYPVIILASRVIAHYNMNYYLFALLLIPFIVIISEIIYRITNFIFFNTEKRNVALIILCVLTIIVIALSIYDRRYNTYEMTNDEIDDVIEKEDIIVNEGSINNTSIELVGKDDKTFKYAADDIKDYNVQKVLKYIDRVNSEIGGDATLSYEDFYNYYNMKISLIGDSVAECSKNALALYFPTSYIDSASNRQFDKAIKVFDSLKEKYEAVGDVVVVSLGTNSDHDINVEDLEKVYYAANGKPVVFMSLVIPNPGEEQKRNAVIRKFVRTHTNCFLADWHGIMKTHSECFQADNTHPKLTGPLAYAQILYKTCIKALTSNDNSQFVNEKFSYLSSGEIGQPLMFGSYHINKDMKGRIEWIVLDKKEDIHLMLLVSKYAIDCGKYNKTYNAISWERSSLRKWLNEVFYEEAFSEEEKDYIRERLTYNDKNPVYDTPLANKTKDSVILLSYDEVKNLMSEGDRKCKATKYAVENGVYEDLQNDKNCDWWLRTSGDKTSNVMYVSSEGKIEIDGDYSITDDFGVRPAIYIRYE